MNVRINRIRDNDRPNVNHPRSRPLAVTAGATLPIAPPQLALIQPDLQIAFIRGARRSAVLA